MSNKINPTYPMINDINGTPLDAGFIFIGVTNVDPESNQLQLFWDQDKTKPAIQPIRTRNGYIVNENQHAKLYVESNKYSIKILNRNKSIVFQDLSHENLADSSSVNLIVDDSKAELVEYIDTQREDIDVELSKKAPLTTTNDLQQKKADITYVDDKVAGVANGLVASFTTYALADAAKNTLPANSSIKVTNDPDPSKNGEYTWDGVTLRKSDYDPKTQAIQEAKEYTDNEINPLRNILYQNEDHPLEVSVDDNGMMYRITNSKGDLHISGTSLSLKESSLNEDENDVVAILDKNTNVILGIDNSGNLHVPNDIVFNNTSLIQSTSESIYAQSSERIYRKIAGQTLQSALLSRTLKRHEVTPVQTLQDTPGLTNRMPTAIKIPTGLFIIWHHKTKPEYDGDGSGSAFWCGFADIDANQNITIRDKKLFMYPDTDAGILKHPHMGRTSDGRIMLVYEKSIGYVEETPTNKVNYIKYVRYSSNNGVTWTSPKQLTFLNEPAVGSVLIALGTTQNILFLNGRHVVPIYSSTSACAAIYSDNDGQTWAYSKTWTKGVNWGDEPALSLDSDNNIVMAIRPSGNPRCITFCKSTDMGDSWSLMHNDRVISPDNQCNILFDDHINAHILSHSTNAPWQRNKHRLSVSYDDCYNFSLNYAPYPETQYVGYSQLIKWSEGIYLLIHEGNASGYDLNVNEEVSILLITLKEVIENVAYS